MPKNCLLEIGAANLEGPFIYDQASNKVFEKTFVWFISDKSLSCQIMAFNFFSR